tara:strand:- start:186 stop:1211 length:1026 start_codon:yes stop_codon:yes gene_type:complete
MIKNIHFLKNHYLSVLYIGFFSIILILIGYVIISTSSFYYPKDDLVIIKKGSSMYDVIQLLNKNNCEYNELFFSFSMRLTGNHRKIKTGRYNFNGINNLGSLIRVITTESSEKIKVTLIEGWTIDEIVNEINQKLGINTNIFIELCNNHNFIHSLGIKSLSLEGFLFPDTYIFLKSYTEEDIITVLVNNFLKKYKKILKENNRTKYTMEEIITMASIIQGEYMIPNNDELPLISSVYHNRLKKKMHLQADPTIQYILPGKNRRLYNKHLKIESPYNTYKYKGLPPGPINNPGEDAIAAAMNPADSDYLYFVADGKGRHIFSKTNQQHNKAKQQLKINRRKY